MIYSSSTERCKTEIKVCNKEKIYLASRAREAKSKTYTEVDKIPERERRETISAKRAHAIE